MPLGRRWRTMSASGHGSDKRKQARMMGQARKRAVPVNYRNRSATPVTSSLPVSAGADTPPLARVRVETSIETFLECGSPLRELGGAQLSLPRARGHPESVD